MPEDQLLNDDPADGDDAAWDAWSHPSASTRRRARAAQRSPRPKLTRRARILITTLVLVAVAGVVVAVLLNVGSGSSVDSSTATRALDDAHTTLVSHQHTCGASDLTCLHQAAGELTLAYRDFDVAVDRVAVPGKAADAASTVEDDAELLSNAYDELSVTPTTTAYQRIYQRDDVTSLLATFDRHYTALVEAVRAG